MKKVFLQFNKAFTLAEVLITLVIIGVIAALTIPTAIQKYHERQIYVAYTRVYGILGQAYLHAQREHGSYEAWEQTSADDYAKFRPYFIISADCPTGRWSGSRGACYSSYYKNFSEDTDKSGYFHSHPAIRLASGESVIFTRDGHIVNFIIDLNGDKAPNRLGEDVHFLSIANDKLVPGPSWDNNRAGFCQRNVDESKWWPGSGCGHWILKHRNTDYLHLTDEEIAAKW